MGKSAVYVINVMFNNVISNTYTAGTSVAVGAETICSAALFLFDGCIVLVPIFFVKAFSTWVVAVGAAAPTIVLVASIGFIRGDYEAFQRVR